MSLFTLTHSFRHALGGTRSVLLAVGLLLPWWAQAQISAARVMSVSGDVKVTDAQGNVRALQKGAEIKSGEKIITAEGALAQVRLNDGGFMSIRPGTEMVIDRFQYDEKNAANSSLLISLIRGGMRSISGMIGKTNPDGYQIKSNTATVGIRGTDHEPMVIPVGASPLAALGQPGLYDKVNDGETFIRNQAGLLAIKKGEVGFTPLGTANMPPQALKVIPDFYKIEVKVDARDPKEAATIDSMGKMGAARSGVLLRPTTAARREALSSGGVLSPLNVAEPSLATTAPITTAPIATTTTTLSPTLSVTEPLKTLSTTDLSTRTLDSSTLLSPTTSTLSTSTLISPTTTSTISTLPTLSTSTLSTTTLSTTTLIAPTTTTTTTITSPTTSTLSTTTISPTLSTTTIKTLK